MSSRRSHTSLKPPGVASLVSQAVAGDHAAFTELVRRHRNLVFAVSLAAVGDAGLAEDISQETFLSAFSSLRSLADPGAFPGWIRQIARRQCARAMRRKRVPVYPIQQDEFAARQLDPEADLVEWHARASVLRALWRIPESQREVVALHYIEGMSQREIAALLGLAVTTVNNRMHEGRRSLRSELTGEASRALRRTRLSNGFAHRVGRILRVWGPVVDVGFEVVDLPDVLEAIEARGDAHKRDAILDVVQRRGHGIVRCVASSAEPIAAGMRAERSGARSQEKPAEDFSRAIVALRRAQRSRPTVVATGIKVIDLLCPIDVGGTVAIVGDAGVGKLVLVQELGRRLAGFREGLGVFTFVRLAEQPWARTVAASMEALVSRPDLTFFLASPPREEAADPVDLPVDTLICLSRARAERHIHPAIDPLRSRSRLLTATRLGRRHWTIAAAVRRALESLGIDNRGASVRNEADGGAAERAWKLQLFLSQPFFVSEPHTAVPGVWVAREDTLATCRDILGGRYDHLPAEAFWFVGARPRVARGTA